MSARSDRLQTLGAQLVAVHDELRAGLRQLRESDEPGLAPTLAGHGLAFCGALTRHHRGEDSDLFTELVAEQPALTPVVEQLRHDHTLISGLLQDVETAAAALPEAPDATELERFRQTLDGLAAIAESHFRFEERRLVAALDAQPPVDRPPSWDVRGARHADDHG